MKKRYAQVGMGGRSRMFAQAVTEKYSDRCEMIGLCDTNPGRLEYARSRMPEAYAALPLYAADDFDRMIAEQKPDCVIVTTPDCFHDVYIVRAMELGCDAITEKPMTIDAPRCRRIVETVRRTGRDVRVTFNYRYAPPRMQVKELLMQDVIGRVLSVELQWLLDTRHGADYYRRWHRRKENSGGLMVHKATHHFDLVNWCIGSAPQEVFAMGKRDFYRPETAERYGLHGRAGRCHDCPVSDKCRFFLDLEGKEPLRKLYLDHESHDGYYRDRCVFSDEIDIEDTMNLTVRYRSGATMSYALNAFMPWEGYIVAFNGTKGRLEHRTQERVYISGDGSTPGETDRGATSIRVFPHFRKPYDVEVNAVKGGHGGGDARLMEDVFGPPGADDPLKRAAGWADGAYSMLTGAAANISMAENRPVRIEELVEGLLEPR